MAEATQMIIFPNVPSEGLDDPTTKVGKAWHEVVTILKQQPGYQRVYWGRQVETPENIQLHIVREGLHHHYNFLSSPAYTTWMKIVATITTGKLTIRHGQISEFSAGCKSLGKGAPVTGTAIYLSTTPDWEHAWKLWVSIVRHVPGFLGIAGGPIIEKVDGQPDAFIALVGWENVEVHDAYHHTNHFRNRMRILSDPCNGFNYYGHLDFGNTGVETTSQPKL